LTTFDAHQTYFLKQVYPSSSANIYCVAASDLDNGGKWCLKQWKSDVSPPYKAVNQEKRREILTRGLALNRLLAKDVYQGIAQIIVRGQEVSVLHTYLAAANEQKDTIMPLLNFFLTEKAIVCAYMWVLHDHRSVLETDGALAGGHSYFDVASFYAQELQTMLNTWPV
jgi:aminoglycoside phosphotransferase family enzyme